MTSRPADTRYIRLLGGYAIGYDIFEGDIYEGHTLIPFIEKISQKFNLNQPIVVADAGLLSNDNIVALESKGYEYILGARLKNEPEKLKEQILENTFINGQMKSIRKTNDTRLVVAYSTVRATKDEHNRKRGLKQHKMYCLRQWSNVGMPFKDTLQGWMQKK